MASNRKPHRSGRVTWGSLKDRGLLTARHVLMALAMGMEASNVEEQHLQQGNKGSLLLEWIEDSHLAQFGSCVPDDGGATPESQAEDPSMEILLPDPDKIMDDFFNERGIEADTEESYELLERVQDIIEREEQNAPMSVGEIAQQDSLMLTRQADLRKAAVSLASRMESISGVEKMWLFGSLALPLWKEVPRFRRFKQRGVKVYHHCHTIDLALEVTNTNCAPVLRKAIVANCRDLVEAEKFLGVEHHMFCLHLVEKATQRYLGMVCHFKQCPKGNPECQVSGCGKFQHVRILPWFKFKPERLNSHNSLVLFERAAN